MKTKAPIRVLLLQPRAGGVRRLRAGLGRELAAAPVLASAATLRRGIARLRGGRFDVVLLDLSLPDGSGLDALRRVLAEEAAPPVVVLTDRADARLGLAAVELGAEDYLARGDADPRVLARVIRYAIARHRSAADLRHSQGLLDAVTLGAETIVAVVDPRLRLLFFNTAFREEVRRLTGSEIALGQSLPKSLASLPRQRAAAAARLRRTLAGEARQVREEYGRPGGYRRVYNVRHAPIRDARGRVVAAGVIAFDVTAQESMERALRESEARLRLHVENSPLAIVEWDAGFVVTRWAGDAERIFGWSAAETVGRGIDDLGLVHEADRRIVARVMARLSDGRTRRVSATNRNRTKDGRVIHCEWHNSVLADAEGRMSSVLSEVVDVTERVRAREELARLAERREVIAAAASRLLGARDPARVVAAVCRGAMRHLDCQVFFNYLLDRRPGALRLNAYAGLPRAEAAKIRRLAGGAAVCGGVARSGRPVVAERVQERPEERTALVRGYGVQAYACHPLRGGDGKVIGTLSFGSRTRERFGEDHLSLMTTIADLVSVALVRKRAADLVRRSNALLEIRVAERTRELRRVSSELVLAEQRERKRLAAFLHDHLQQILAGAKLGVGRLRMLSEGEALDAPLAAIETQLAAAVRASRSLTGELAPPALSSQRLPAALEWLGLRMEEEHGLRVTVRTGDWERIEDEALTVLLFQSVKELLFNVVKHAGVGRAEVRLARPAPGRLSIEVRDEGRGYHPAAAAGVSPPTYGLSSVAERVRHLGGEFEVSSAPGRGTAARISVPLAPAASPRGRLAPRRRSARPAGPSPS